MQDPLKIELFCRF